MLAHPSIHIFAIFSTIFLIYLMLSWFLHGAFPQILEKTEDFFSKIKGVMREAANICYDRFKEFPSIYCPYKPEGSMFIMVKLNLSLLEDIDNDMDFCLKLAKEEFVIILPGKTLKLTLDYFGHILGDFRDAINVILNQFALITLELDSRTMWVCRAVAEHLSKDLPYKLSPYDAYITIGSSLATEFILAVLSGPGADILLPRKSYPYYEARAAYEHLQVCHSEVSPHDRWLGSLVSW
ncbi:hypothetical protein RJ641_015530 [Dillenia turbinata]|uniref:Aminotransferase class I/classII domain-containing protein n=1 Tax=Dillenia turbinata TaxID=194707 RepID=A0AAN8UX19_9MAGN